MGAMVRLMPEKPNKGMIEYRQAIRDLRSRPFAWWQERVKNNAFEIKHVFNKEGSFTRVLSMADSSY